MRGRKIIAGTLIATLLFSNLGYSAEEEYLSIVNDDNVSAELNVSSSVGIEDTMIWNFSDDYYSNLKGTETAPIEITSPISHNGIKVNATTTHPIRLDKTSVSFDEDHDFYGAAHTITTCLNLMGKGRDNYRNIQFDVGGPTDVYVIAKSSQIGTIRTLRLSDHLDNTGLRRCDYEEINKTDLYKLSYQGTDATTLYLASVQDKIEIFAIAVVPRDYDSVQYKNVWDFSDFADYSTASEIFIDEKTTEDDVLTIYANSSYKTKIVKTTNNKNGFQYKQCLDLEGIGNIFERCVSFVAHNNSDVYITARSRGNTNRYLEIRNLCGDDVVYPNEIMVTPEIETYKISINDMSHILKLYSKEDSIRIYNISVVPQSESTDVNLVDLNFDDLADSFVGTTFTVDDELYNLGICGTTTYPIELVNSNGRKALKARTNAPFKTWGGYFSFDVPNSNSSTTNIKVVATSNSNIYIANAYGYIIGTIPANSTITETNIQYNGYTDKLYMYSTGTMYLHSLKVENSSANANSYALSANSISHMSMHGILSEDSVIDEESISKFIETSEIAHEGTLNLNDDSVSSGSAIALY